MKEKIINIRNILKIIISLFIIFTFIKSCSKAYTWDDMIDFANQIATSSTARSEIKSVANNFIQNQLTMKNNLLANNINVNNYSNFVFMKSGSNNPQIWVFNTNANSTATTGVSNKRNYLNINNITGKKAMYYYSNEFHTISDTTNVATNGDHPYYWFGLTTINFTPTNDMWMQNIYIPVPKMTFTPYYWKKISYNNIPNVNAIKQGYSVGYWSIGTMTNEREVYYYELKFKDEVQNVYLGTLSGNSTTYDYVTRDGYIGNQNDGNIWFNSMYARYNNLYSINVHIYTDANTSTSETYYFVYLPVNAVVENGEIVSVGSGDYTTQDAVAGIVPFLNNIESGNKATTEAVAGIENLLKEMESGNKKKQTFWENAYNNLFVVDSGDIEDVINNIVENTDINGIALYSGDRQILNILTGEPSDFVISWDPVMYEGQAIIPGGNINFSQKIREIPELKAVIDWAHIIMRL